ncbi:MAG: alpha/beta hydrolase [Nannocystis sp.]|nr:alpha/beta hydrolase-fold protein [Nannocystis sp.]MBA3545703.1 alpha/beta hydrolase [Nannocystis sp.]
MSAPILHKLGPFRVPWLNGERHVRVYVPHGRPGAGPQPMHALHPVIYMFDGQNIFHDDPSFSGGWHLHHSVQDLVSRGRPAPVIVGIDHGGRHRIDELSPFRCRMSKGQLNRLLGWMNKTLIPRIHADFPVRRDVGGAAVGGSSMGGLAALYAHYQRPELFGAALCMSPSLWLARGKIFRWLEKQSRPWTSRIYVDAGAREGRIFNDAEKLAAHLRLRGYDDHNLRWRPDPIGRHTEADWRRRAPSALEFLFAGAGAHERAA